MQEINERDQLEIKIGELAEENKKLEDAQKAMMNVLEDSKELEKIIGQEFAKDTKTLYGRNVVVPYFANLQLSCVSFVVGLFLLAKLCGR